MRISLLLTGLCAASADLTIRVYADAACTVPTPSATTVLSGAGFIDPAATIACMLTAQKNWCDSSTFRAYNWAESDASKCTFASVTSQCPIENSAITYFLGDDSLKPCYIEIPLDTCAVGGEVAGVKSYVKITGTCGMASGSGSGGSESGGSESGGSESGGSSDDGDPCFARDTLAISPSGETIPMTSLKAGDLVMDGPGSTARVIVNQHREATFKSSLLELEHANGKLSLTPDHVLEVDGEFVPARLASAGSKLGEAEVYRVIAKAGEVINPLTSSGKILTQGGVLASTYPEWIAKYMLSSYLVPLPLSLSNLVSYVFPETAQAFYDALLEPLVTKAHPKHLKAALPAPLLPAAFLLGDLALASGFVAFALASPLAAVAAAAVILAANKARKGGKR